MLKRKITRIRTEVNEIWSITTSGHRPSETSCRCGANAQWLELREATVLSAMTEADLMDLVVAGKVHHFQATSGDLYVCWSSLSLRISDREAAGDRSGE